LGSRFLSGHPPWVNDILKMDRVTIVHDKPNFVQLLPHHGIVIIDTPTTILLQALATRLPVFVLNSIVRWPDEAIHLLKKRAYCFESANDLIKSLGNYIEGKQVNDLRDDSFLEEFGMHDHNSINNALGQLKKIFQ